MSLLSLIGIATAHASTAAATTPAQHQGFSLGMLPMLILIIAVFYFLMIRPQQKRAKAQKTLMEQISVGDEIITIGGIVAKVAKLRDTFVVLTIANGVEITMRKAAIESVLPKGTMESD
ncbi:MAG: preprotein translocase subunit YajC [Coxiellaceae bacterium]|nr:preprotein translocase subunit YajC [Coxiellaceae bacterium]